MRNSTHDGEGLHSIGSKTIRKEFFTRRPSPEVPAEVRVDGGKGGSESTFVHFRQLFQEGGTMAKSFDTTGKSEHAPAILREAGREGASFVFAVFMPQYGGGNDFRESKNVHSCHLRTKSWDLRRPETDKHSVTSNEGKVFRLPSNPLTLKEATS